MADSSTGTPLTRRAAREAAEQERSRRADASMDTTQSVVAPVPESRSELRRRDIPREEPHEEQTEVLAVTAVLPTTDDHPVRPAFIAMPPHPTVDHTLAQPSFIAIPSHTPTPAPQPRRPAVRVGAAAAVRSVGGRVADVQLLGEHDADALSDAVVALRTATRHRARRTLVVIAAAVTVLFGGTAAVAATTASTSSTSPPAAAASSSPSSTQVKPAASAPSPAASSVANTASASICTIPAVAAALKAHNTEAAVKAAGGGAVFRTAVATGKAPCVQLSDPRFTWVVVNKKRPYNPKSYQPGNIVKPAGVRSIEGGGLRSDAAAALSSLAAAAKRAGAGEIALDSGYRSYRTQVTSYGVQVANRGTTGADIVSARPGFSEHQSGLSGDVVACSGGGCGNLDMLAGTKQDAFILAHGWEYGWIVRYEQGQTAVTGYKSEPWHLRYIGPQLAKAYHDGGFHTLEQFFGLPAAPKY